MLLLLLFSYSHHNTHTIGALNFCWWIESENWIEKPNGKRRKGERKRMKKSTDRQRGRDKGTYSIRIDTKMRSRRTQIHSTRDRIEQMYTQRLHIVRETSTIVVAHHMRTRRIEITITTPTKWNETTTTRFQFRIFFIYFFFSSFLLSQ